MYKFNIHIPNICGGRVCIAASPRVVVPHCLWILWKFNIHILNIYEGRTCVAKSSTIGNANTPLTNIQNVNIKSTHRIQTVWHTTLGHATQTHPSHSCLPLKNYKTALFWIPNSITGVIALAVDNHKPLQSTCILKKKIRQSSWLIPKSSSTLNY